MNPIEQILSVLTPYDCLLCGREGRLICDWCWFEAFDIVPSRCFLCKKATKGFATCEKCRKTTRLEHVFVATPYNKVAKKLVHSMKIGSVREVCSLIAKYLDQEALYLQNTVISYVPTAPIHVRQRGFDHTKMISKEFARYRGLQHKTLLKRYDSSKQVGKSRKQRLLQLNGVFELALSINKDESVLLIDDVTTTGATISEASKVLKKSGVNHIDGLVFAQTV